MLIIFRDNYRMLIALMIGLNYHYSFKMALHAEIFQVLTYKITSRVSVCFEKSEANGCVLQHSLDISDSPLFHTGGIKHSIGIRHNGKKH